ncbi:MAG TPA: DUF1080 domain-containing protein [Pirellulales bacterium]
MNAKKSLIACCAAGSIFVSSVALSAEPNSPSAEKPAVGDGKFKSLFDGKTLDGWKQIPDESWIVKDGVMASNGVARGVLYTDADYSHYRLLFSMRHVEVTSGNKDHRACVLFFCTRPELGEKPLDALAGIQFQVPNGGHWDYRPKHNNDGGEEFTAAKHAKFDEHQWSRVELLVNADKGTARMAVAQPVDAPAVEVLSFDVPEAGRKGPIAWQIHNKGLLDEYKDVSIEVDPKVDELITVREAKK